MLGINLVCPGNLKEAYLRDAASEYARRLSRFCRLTVTEVAESTPEKEKDQILRHLRGTVVALCIEGQELSSTDLAAFVEKTSLTSSEITFVIGSSCGLAPEVKAKADIRLSFSAMTFPHQLMRVMLLEQIYRAMTIVNHVPYHK